MYCKYRLLEEADKSEKNRFYIYDEKFNTRSSVFHFINYKAIIILAFDGACIYLYIYIFLFPIIINAHKNFTVTYGKARFSILNLTMSVVTIKFL